jgi:FkbM family methyltransferase
LRISYIVTFSHDVFNHSLKFDGEFFAPKMNKILHRLLRHAMSRFGYAPVRLAQLEQLSEITRDFEDILRLPEERLIQLLRYSSKAKSQNRQDLFALSELDFKRNGYFVEFGATDGVLLSNSYLLETEFGWKGILAEPATCWHKRLRLNRSCHIDSACVWKESNKTITFHESEIPELSTMNGCSLKGLQGKRVRRYDVKTISLQDLLLKYDAPYDIDFLSIDTEGTEYEILKAFDFAKYQFRVIACEHNFAPQRENILKLLSAHGYQRKFLGLSNWDDWFVKGR